MWAGTESSERVPAVGAGVGGLREVLRREAEMSGREQSGEETLLGCGRA